MYPATAVVEHVYMNRTLILAGSGILVCASYLAVIFGMSPDATVGPLVFASIALPGIVMALYVIWETRNARHATTTTGELSAQLIRKEIEIGRLSTVDELTGLYTRREFDEMIRLEFERFRRHKRESSFLILEIDDIAELSDHLGQLGKGFLLAEVSAIIKHALRNIDLGCRYTNDTLAVLLPETNAAQARIVAGKIQAAVSKREFLGQRQDGKLKLTVSQGIAVAGPAAKSHVDLMRAAEQALAEARASGYDQVKVAQAQSADEGHTAAA